MTRLIYGLVAFAGAICIASFGGAGAAFAQAAAAAANTSIDFKPLLDQVVYPALSVVAIAGAGWIAAKINKRLKLENDSIVRGYLETALQRGLDFAKSQTAGVNLTVDVKNEMVAAAANYAIKKVPDALKHFRIDEAGLKEMLAARLESPPPMIVVPTTPPAAS